MHTCVLGRQGWHFLKSMTCGWLLQGHLEFFQNIPDEFVFTQVRTQSGGCWQVWQHLSETRPLPFAYIYCSSIEKFSQFFTIRDKDDNIVTHWDELSFNPSNNVIWFCWLLLHNAFCFMWKLSRRALKCCHVELCPFLCHILNMDWLHL